MLPIWSLILKGLKYKSPKPQKNVFTTTIYKHQRIQEGQSKMDNPEKLATQSTQDEDKHNKSTTQYVFDTNMRKQTQIT